MIGRQGQRRRPAFTLIELLVVIAIIAILIGLLLPAVQKVREAAARTKCSNNLKQMALGMHMYQDANGSLPTGWLTTDTAQPSPGWSWAIILLPFIEQKPLYDSIAAGTTGGIVGTTAPPTSGAVFTLCQTNLALYHCPSDSGPATNSLFQNYGFSNYVINREVLGPNSGNKPANMRVEQIRDGSSNTILIGERDSVKNTAAVYVRSSTSSCSFEGRPGKGLNIPNPNNPPSTGPCERLGFNSGHTGVCIFALGDGSIRNISNAISSAQDQDACAFPASTQNFPFQNLIHPADGNPVSNF